VCARVPARIDDTNLVTFKFSLHLNMAQDCMNLFEKHKLPLVANVEQVAVMRYLNRQI
jgi:hypothetical protein